MNSVCESCPDKYKKKYITYYYYDEDENVQENETLIPVCDDCVFKDLSEIEIKTYFKNNY